MLRRCVQLALVGGLVLTVITGCGDEGPSTAGDGAAAEPSTPAAASSPGDDVTRSAAGDDSAASLIPGRVAPEELPPAPLQARGDAPVTSSTWQLLGVSADGRLLGLRVAVDGCTELSHVDVRETATSVQIDVLVRPGPGADGPCVQSAELIDRRVELDSPLADRSLVSGYDGSEVTVR